MRKEISRCLSSLLVAMIIISCIPMQAFAVNNNENGGTGGGGGQSDGSYTWISPQSGYRISLVNKEFQRVSNTIDMLMSDPTTFNYGTNGCNYYTNKRAEQLRGYDETAASEYDWVLLDNLKSDGVINDYPPYPVGFQTGSATAGGESFKKWFMNGQDGMGSIITYVTRNAGNTGGTTRPNTSNSSRSYNDMAPISLYNALNDEDYAREVYAESAMSLTELELIYEAQQRADSEIEAANRYTDFQLLHDNSANIGDLYSDYITDNADYYESTSSSNNESAYIITSVLKDYGWGSESSFEALDGLYTQPINTETNTSTRIENIPLTDDDNTGGYATEILNSHNPDGSYRFKFKPEFASSMYNGGNSSKNETYDQRHPTDVLQENGYTILVEPVFWFRPAASNSNFLPTSPMHSNYVYGTFENIREFYESKGYAYGSGGGAYGVIGGTLGWRCMYTGKDWPEGNPVITKRDYYGSVNLSSLDTNTGYAMHLYTTNPPVTSSQPTGNPLDPLPHEAPIPEPEPVVPTGYARDYKIVKYYQDVSPTETTEAAGPLYAAQIVPNIDIINELNSDTTGYAVKGWFITKSDFTDPVKYKTYAEADTGEQAAGQQTQTGASATTVHMETGINAVTKAAIGTTAYGEKTLFVLLQRNVAPPVAGPLTLSESEVTKAITTIDTTITNWGPRTFTFTYPTMADSDTHSCGDPLCTVAHDCSAVFGDSAYNYVISNSATIDKLIEANAADGSFASRMVNNTSSGSASIAGGSSTLETPAYQTVIWRGEDVPTIASYKEDSTINLKDLLGRYGKDPAGDRALNGPYQRTIKIQLNLDSSSDITTHSIHSYTGSRWHEVTHGVGYVNIHEGTVAVNVFRGTNSKSKGDETVATEIQTSTPFGGAISNHSAGYMMSDETPIYFYPYIRMTYQTVNQSTKTDVNILSQWFSTVIPNDFAEASWYNEDEDDSLKISSTQWSLHAKATSAGLSWNGPNQVLTGGAIFQLGTGEKPSQVALVTWQTLVTGNERAALAEALPVNDYTLNKATLEHNKYVSQAKITLESLRAVQWVNANVAAEHAWDNNGQSVKIVNADESLSNLGLTTKTSTEYKYRLGKDNSGDAGNEGDIDIIKDTPSKDTYYKVFADTSGDVYLAKSIDDITALDSINGSNIGSSTKLFDKTVKSDAVDTALTALTDTGGKELNKRTLIITNFVKAIERNKGNDSSASWAPDAKWYNEAWDGIIVCRKANILDVGFNMPGVRSAVLDPRICPPNSGQSDLFSKALLSQFRLDSKSDDATAINKPDHFLASFRAKDIFLLDMESMYVSKKFYVPNVNVQDLN